MATALSAETRDVLDQLFHADTDRVRDAAVTKLTALPAAERDSAVSVLIEHLDSEPDEWLRGWIVWALATVGAARAGDVIARHLDPGVETSDLARYWAVVGLSAIEFPDLVKVLGPVLDDNSPWVKASAMRVLLENDVDEHADTLLRMIRDNADWRNRAAACKALRRRTHTGRALRETIEGKFTSALKERLLDRKEFVDCRFQAAMALADVHHRWPDAVKAFAEALGGEDLPDSLRRVCIDSLRRFNKPETRTALLGALKDPDAEIRYRAAKALREVGTPDALALVIDCLTLEQTPSPQYVDALRHIDGEAAAKLLTERLSHPDPKISSRAIEVLALLGGQEATRTLQAQRTKALDRYTELLGDADKAIMKQYEGLMGRVRGAFILSMWMHGLVFALGLVLLAVSLWVTLSSGFGQFERFVGVGGAGGALGTLLLMFYRNPLKNIADSVTRLVQVNVIFLGYVRQINQIDATFKQLFLSSNAFGTDQMKQTVSEIQGTVTQTMGQVKSFASVAE